MGMKWDDNKVRQEILNVKNTLGIERMPSRQEIDLVTQNTALSNKIMKTKGMRGWAKELGLEVHNKPDSQEICFVKDNDYANYVKRHANQDIKEGNFVDTKGNILGRHKGIVFYTIGQRKGLGIAFGKPMFVLDINPETNEVILGSNDDLFSNELIAKDVNLITVDEITEPIRVEAKIRYSARPAAATVYNNGKDSIRIVFDEPQRAITKGQSVVMYQGDKVVGGGIIDKSL